MTLGQIKEQLRIKTIGRLERAGRVFENELHKIVAIDTGRLNQSIKTDSVRISGDKFSVEIGSFGVPYAGFVDKANTIKNYHRRKKVVYTGAGQEYIGRAFEEKREEMNSILKGKT